MNLGLRYEIEFPRTDRFNQLTNFDYGATPPLNAPGLNLRGALSFAGVGGVSRFQGEPDLNNFAPRVGVAWRVTPKTVVRSGAGMFYSSLTGIGNAPTVFGVTGFLSSTDITTSLDGVTPIVTLNNPFPNGVNKASGSSLGAASFLGQSVAFDDRSNRVPDSLAMELRYPARAAPECLVRGGLRGHARAQAAAGPQPEPVARFRPGARRRSPPVGPESVLRTDRDRTACLADGGSRAPDAALSAVPGRDFFGQFLGQLELQRDCRLKSKSATRRASRLLGSYTYSKAMDYLTGVFNGESVGATTGSGVGGVQNWNYLKGEYSPSALDETHRLIVNGVYELPFFRKQNGAVGHVLGGWALAAIGSSYPVAGPWASPRPPATLRPRRRSASQLERREPVDLRSASRPLVQHVGLQRRAGVSFRHHSTDAERIAQRRIAPGGSVGTQEYEHRRAPEAAIPRRGIQRGEYAAIWSAESLLRQRSIRRCLRHAKPVPRAAVCPEVYDVSMARHILILVAALCCAFAGISSAGQCERGVGSVPGGSDR